jgi:hypothetical protein
MRSCLDCIHYERCDAIFDGVLSNRDNKPCDWFDAKAQYVKLPAYIGQRVWLLYVHYYKEIYSKVEEGKVSMLQQKVDGTWKIRISRNGSVSDYTVEDFGKNVFLTEEAAEIERKRLTKALKEQHNGN